MKEYNIGSVLSGGESVPRTQATARDWIDMINKFQNWDPELVKRIGAATALEVRATGIQYSFAPCVSVCRDPRWGRCYESFSEDLNIVKQMTDFVIGLPGEIPAGSPMGVPYVGGIWNGVKMHANYDLVTKYLKDTLKFKGIVISDWLGVDKISNPPFTNYSNSVLLSIQAGLDMIMLPYNYIDFIKFLTEHVNNKCIPMRRIDDAVRRILSVKFMMGLFEKPMSSYEYIPRLGCQEHRDLGRELVLLKNGKTPTAPLLRVPKKANRILVAGTHANNLGYQCGGWSLTWQGVSGNSHTVGIYTSIYISALNHHPRCAIASAVNETTEIIFSLNPDPNFVKANKFDYAVVAVGELPYAETKGYSVNLTIPEPGPSIITNVCGAVKCAVIVVSGRPVVIEPYLLSMDALVAAWLPGTEGQGVADVLYGDYGFTGKLPRTWFRRVDQLPMNFGEKNFDPFLPFGFGLTTRPVNNGVKPSQAN
ncbi:hypothetical protein ACE6H2_020285 [Prunus campanulata]